MATAVIVANCDVAEAPPSKGRTAITKPQKALPTSPMKIRAGGQLQVRKPIDAPANARLTAATGSEPTQPAAAAIATPATAAVIPAIPSMPSIKLKAFVIPTIQRSVSGQAAKPRSKVPRLPKSAIRTGPSTAVAAAAAARCTPNRTRLRRGFRSSSQLTAAIARAGIRNATSGSLVSGQRTAARITAQAVTATIEIPPPRGVARVWLDRSLGRSMTPRALVQPMSHSVATDAVAAATRNQADQQANENQSVTPPAWRWRSHRRPRRR